jgi:malate dehydrogenase
MRVSVVGAAGDVGRAFAAHLLRSRLLGPSDELQLVGHGAKQTERMLLAIRVDLLDAFDETAPTIRIAPDLEDVRGEVIVMAAGATVSPERPSRRDLAEANRPVFEELGAAIARSGSGRELVVVVSNPVELGVAILARHLDRHRVLGMGAQQDSLRFARAIAADAALARDRVHAWVLGEHGDAIVPLWSDVRIAGLDPDRLRTTVARTGARMPWPNLRRTSPPRASAPSTWSEPAASAMPTLTSKPWRPTCGSRSSRFSRRTACTRP